MPQFSHEDRQMVELEQVLWNVHILLTHIQNGGCWRKRIDEVQIQVELLAREVRDYNDQFDRDEDE